MAREPVATIAWIYLVENATFEPYVMTIVVPNSIVCVHLKRHRYLTTVLIIKVDHAAGKKI